MTISKFIGFAVAGLLEAALLAGCGYRPLYGSSPENPGVAAQLSSVVIREATTRTGQIIRNDLISSLQPGNGGAPERYTLSLTPEVRSTAVIDKPQPVTTRESLNLTVSYELTDQKTGNVVHQGKTFSQVSYDVVRQPFADKQAEADATARAAHEVSADIRTRLAAYFASHQ